MKIHALEAENIKCLKSVEITPTGAIVPITGRNASGKSSVLDSIWWALAGASHIQAQPIRTGETTARIKLDLGELIVERRFSEDKGTQISVQNSDGAKYSSPQRMLTDLLGALSFDPLAFVAMKPKEQSEALRSALGVDFTELDYTRTLTFEERTDVNRDAKRLQAAADEIVLEGEAPTDIRPADEIIAAIQEAMENNKLRDARADKRIAAHAKIKDNRDQAALLLAEAEDLENKLNRAVPLPDPIDIDVLNQALAQSKTADAWRQKAEHQENADAAVKKSDDLTAKIADIDGEKQSLIAAANMPVDGLGFGEDSITFEGLPFDQASTAQQLRVSVALAMAANPKLRVIRIKEGSLLDDNGMELLAEMAAEHDYQIWVERVDSSGKVGIVIEDGQVAAVNAA